MSKGLEKYYKILGLPTSANEAEIKKRYRKLVFIHHPDKNGGDETQFIAITEAYEILSGKKQVPQQTVVTSRSSSSVAQKTKEERVREAQQRYKDQVYSEHIENERYFKRLTSGWRWRVIKYNAISGTIISLALLTEPYLPKHYEEAQVEAYSLYRFKSFHENLTSLIILDNSEEYFVANADYDLFGGVNKEVYIERSWLLHNPLRIISKHPSYLEYYQIEITLGSHNVLFGFILLIPLITLLYKKRTILFTMVYYISFYGISLLLLYILFTNDRWAHLLSLGFF